MTNKDISDLWKSMSLLLRSHPWHGIPIGDQSPDMVNTYVETVPTDTVKYEIDKSSGFLKVDRPQKYSNICPTLYGFIPQTYCGDLSAKHCNERAMRSNVVGDDDPLDICILTEKTITHGDIMIRAIPIGGFRMLDGGQADDKIIAVMHGDALYSQWHDVSDIPKSFVDRLKHYFLTYKDAPDATEPICKIVEVYDRAEAHVVINLARRDYEQRFSNLLGINNG